MIVYQQNSKKQKAKKCLKTSKIWSRLTKSAKFLKNESRSIKDLLMFFFMD